MPVEPPQSVPGRPVRCHCPRSGVALGPLRLIVDLAVGVGAERGARERERLGALVVKLRRRQRCAQEGAASNRRRSADAPQLLPPTIRVLPLGRHYRRRRLARDIERSHRRKGVGRGAENLCRGARIVEVASSSTPSSLPPMSPPAIKMLPASLPACWSRLRSVPWFRSRLQLRLRWKLQWPWPSASS